MSPNKKKKIIAYLFIAPVLIMLVVLVLYPMCYALYLSVMKTNLTNKWKFVGFKNYLKIFKNGTMTKSLLVTFKYTFVVCLGHLFFGTLFALALNKRRPGIAFFRTILIIPWLLPDVVVALLYKWIFNANYGVFNIILCKFGILEKSQAWLSTPAAFWILAFVCIWKGYALVMVNVLAGLQSVPTEVYEAAELDGVNPVQKFFKITFPMIKPVIATSVILDIIWWFKHYTLISLLTDGGPNNTTATVSVTIFKEAFSFHNYGEAAAEAGVVFLVCFLISKIMGKVLSEDE